MAHVALGKKHSVSRTEHLSVQLEPDSSFEFRVVALKKQFRAQLQPNKLAVFETNPRRRPKLKPITETEKSQYTLYAKSDTRTQQREIQIIVQLMRIFFKLGI